MEKLGNLKIGTRLALAFGLVVLLMIGIVITAKIGLARVGQEMELINQDRYPKVRLVSDVKDAVNLQARAARNVLLMDDAADREKEIKTIAEQRALVAERYATLEKMLTTEAGKQLFAKLQTERADYVREMDAYLKLVAGGDLVAAKPQLLAKLRTQQLQYMKVLEEFAEYQEKLMANAGLAAAQTVASVQWQMLAAAALAVVLAAFAAWSVANSVTRPLRIAVDALEKVAAGDLTVQVDTHRQDEVGRLLRALQATVDSLGVVVGNVRASVEQVATASGQIAQGNTDLSQRTEEQASSLQQTAASMEQMTATVRHNADNARAANQLAASASAVASQGGDAVQRVVETMSEIQGASRRIAEILSTIDGIAFQTNILALNAAVEAARAGEQGRGFAVVASEVRVLAQRSAEAAKQIKSLITDSVEKAEAGSALVNDAGATMGEIVNQVRRVTDLIAEITASTNEQTSGLDQVNVAVGQLDQTTQQNAALVEESAAAAESLKQQAARLAESVRVFRLATG